MGLFVSQFVWHFFEPLKKRKSEFIMAISSKLAPERNFSKSVSFNLHFFVLCGKALEQLLFEKLKRIAQSNARVSSKSGKNYCWFVCLHKIQDLGSNSCILYRKNIDRIEFLCAHFGLIKNKIKSSLNWHITIYLNQTFFGINGSI